MQKILFVFLIFVFAQNAFAQNELLEKGNKQCELNNFPAAIETFKKAAKSTPNSADILSKLADTYLRLGDSENALNYFEKASNTKSADALVAFKYGKALMKSGKYAEAKKQFESYAAKNPIEGKHFSESCDFAMENATASSIYSVAAATIINTQHDEFGAAFLPNQLVYSSGRTDMQRKNSKMSVGSNQLYTSDLKDGVPSSNAFFKSELKNTYNDGPISYAANAKNVVITHNNIMNGIGATNQNGLELSLAIAEVNPSGEWNNARPFAHNMPGYATGFGSLSADGNTLYFASDRPGGQGGFDLYSSKRNGDVWESPINLGDVVNTAGNEITPFVEGKNLFFSSDYHQGLGGYDVLRAEGNAGKFNVIYHLGNQVNSSGDDYHFAIKDGSGFVTSNRAGGKGGTDIYTVSKTAGEIIVSVKDADNQPVADATLDFSNCNEPTFTTDKNGKYSFLTAGQFTCKVLVSKEGFANSTININASRGTFEAKLAKETPKFVGLLTDSKGNPLDGAKVKATNKETGKVVESTTNMAGEYRLALDKNADYAISFSRPNFINLQDKIRTSDLNGADVLGKHSLLSVGEALPIEAGTSVAYTTSKGGLAGTSKQGFAVQIASVSGAKADLTPYEKIKSIGTIYTTNNESVTKVKIGTFAKREEAVTALNKVKEQGFIQAFIIEEGKIPVKPKPDMTEKGESKSTEKPTEMERVKITPFTDYKVRIVTLSNPSKFDKTELEKIGTIGQLKSGENTVMVLTNFISLDEAKAARDKAQGIGFKDAHIVLPKEGKLTKVE